MADGAAPGLPDSASAVIALCDADAVTVERTVDGVPTLWIPAARIVDVLRLLRTGVTQPYAMLYDLTAVDERLRKYRDGLPAADFTVVYHLLSVARDIATRGQGDIRIKVALRGDYPSLPTVSGVYPNANWYEREVWDLFGIGFEGHPGLRRILLPPTWTGHPLRKDYPARATEFDPFHLDALRQDMEQEALRFIPEDWGMKRSTDDHDFMFLNLGPTHPSAHGAFRLVVHLDG
jgi:NADH-quinone oxidoreductase subunit C/D